VSDEDTRRAFWQPGSRGVLHVHQQGAVNPNLDFAVDPGQNFEGVPLVSRILPAFFTEASLFAALADDQKGTLACTTTFDATIGCCVVLVVEGVVEADEVALVVVSEDDARVIVIAILDLNSELVVVRGSHEILSDEPRAATVATRLVPEAAPVAPVTAIALASIAPVALAALVVLETTLDHLVELGLECFGRAFASRRDINGVLKVPDLDL